LFPSLVLLWRSVESDKQGQILPRRVNPRLKYRSFQRSISHGSPIGHMTSNPHKKAKVGGPCSSWQIPSHAGRDLLILGACWFASLLVVWPVGNFPLN